MDEALSRGLKKALEKAKAAVGGASELSRALGDITPQGVGQWKRVPAGRALAVARVTGISVHELRPDVFGAPESKHSDEAGVQSNAHKPLDSAAGVSG